MNAKAHATLFPAPRLVPLRPRGESHLVRRANKPYLKARREAEASLWTRRQNRADAVTRPVATRLALPGSDRAETRVMYCLLGLAVVAVGGLIYAGFASGDFLGGVRAVVQGALR